MAVGTLSRGSRGCLAALLAAALWLGSAAPADAVRGGAVRDPSVPPHVREQAAHGAGGLTPAARAITPAPLAGRAPAAGPRREVFGFAPYWELGAAGSWDMSLLSTIAYFGLDVNGAGGLDTSTPGWTGWTSQQLANVVSRAHGSGVRVVLTIKQFDEATINRIVTDPAVTDATVAHTVDAVASHGLDGVNVDFEGRAEPKYPGIQGGVTRFTTVLSDRVHQRWPAAEVTLDTYSGAASWDSGIFKIGDLAPHVDAFFVMAYDMAPSNLPGQAAPNAPLAGFTYNDGDAVAQYLAKAPASKVILGVPYYGYKWSTAGSGLYAKATSGATADAYVNILSDFACAKMTRAYDDRSKTPWTAWYSPGSGDPCGANRNSWRELYYDDAGSLGLKYDLVNARGLRGTGMWALGYDGSSRDLWNELAAKFR
jgi:GH18 family chitinase